MKKLIALSVLFCALFMVGNVRADDIWVGTVCSGVGPCFNGVQTFDWAALAPGVPTANGAALGVGPFGTPLEKGDIITFIYQAPLAALLGPATIANPNGTVIGTPGLGDTWEYTVVAILQETVISASADFIGSDLLLSTAVFQTTGGSFYILNDHAADANFSNGTGFTDGTLAASGTITGGAGNFTAYGPAWSDPDTAGSGNGGSTANGLVDYANGSLLIPASIIFDFHFQAQQNYIQGGYTAPPIFFGGTNNTGNSDYDPLTITNNDLLLSIDGTSDFSATAIPEPGTLLLLGAGLLGLAGFARKRNCCC